MDDTALYATIKLISERHENERKNKANIMDFSILDMGVDFGQVSTSMGRPYVLAICRHAYVFFIVFRGSDCFSYNVYEKRTTRKS